MNLYHFNVEGKGSMPGWTAGVHATYPEEALRILSDHLDRANQELQTFDRCSDHSDAPHVHFLNAWNNARPLTLADIDEVSPI